MEGSNGGTQTSLGPGGRLAGEDLRIELRWISDPGADGPGDYARALTVGARERYYEVHVPPSYQRDVPLAVVLVLHGGGGFPGVARHMTGMSDLADETGEFIAVYPAGTHQRYRDRILYWNPGWSHKERGQGDVDDVEYFDALIDDLSGCFAIDLRRVYATGISNGAHMTVRLASDLPHRIAAIATVAGQVSPGQLSTPPNRPMPLIHFHGSQDRWNPWDGGRPPKSAFSDVLLDAVPDVIRGWAVHNGWSGGVEHQRIGAAHSTRYAPPAGGAEVVLWELEGGGHTWPGGRVTRVERTGRLGLIKVGEPVGPLNMDISASELMWAFFQRHPLP